MGGIFFGKNPDLPSFHPLGRQVTQSGLPAGVLCLLICTWVQSIVFCAPGHLKKIFESKSWQMKASDPVTSGNEVRVQKSQMKH